MMSLVTQLQLMEPKRVCIKYGAGSNKQIPIGKGYRTDGYGCIELEDQNAHVFSPKEAFSNFNESHLIEFLDKGDPQKSKKPQTVLDSVFFYLHTYSKVPLLKATTMQLIENGDVNSPTQHFLLCCSVFDEGTTEKALTRKP